MARADMESRLLQRTELITIYENIENYFFKYQQKFRNYEGVFKRNIESRLKVKIYAYGLEECRKKEGDYDE